MLNKFPILLDVPVDLLESTFERLQIPSSPISTEPLWLASALVMSIRILSRLSTAR